MKRVVEIFWVRMDFMRRNVLFVRFDFDCLYKNCDVILLNI